MANFKFVKSATALALGASVLTSAVVVPGADASAKTTYKVNKNGTLVSAKTNKTVKGYKSYKGKLYKNGKKFTGVYSKRYYKNGVKATGAYKGAYYVKGVKKVTTGTYNGAYYVKGVKKVTTGTYAGAYYVKGVKKVTTGTYNKAYYVKGKKVVTTGLYENKYYKDGVLNVGLALFQDKLYKDADLATGIFTWNGVEDLYKDGVVVPTKVESVSADNSKTVTLKGTNLSKLTAADITVANNTVTGVTFSADRTTATVTVKDALASDIATKVTVKDASFDVTYKIAATTVAVTEATYDDDTANQSVAITVDGKKYTAQELIDAGYNVEFSAYSKKSGTDITSTVFGNTAAGILKTDLESTLIQAITGTVGTIPTAGQDIYVSVKLTKGTNVITSDAQKITIKNQEVAANSFVSTTLSNYGTTAPTNTATVDDAPLFNQTSKTLVKGEYAAVHAATVKTTNESEDILGSKLTVKSSDSTVVSVDSKGFLKAQTPGTATITVTYGGATTTFTVTVKNEAREVAKASVVSKASSTTEVSSNTLIKSNVAQPAGYVWALDQYGDPIATTLTVVSSDATTIAPQVATVSTLTTAATLFNVTTLKAGSANITFKDAAGNKVTTNAFKVSATENATVSSYKLDLAPTATTDSTDLTLDLKNDSTATFALNGYTSEGVKALSGIDLTTTADVNGDGTTGASEYKYTVSLNESKPGVVTTSGNTAANLAVTAGKEGTATITVKDNVTGKDIANVKVTVVNVGYNVTAASLKTIATPTYAKTYTYKDILSYKDADTTVDPVISGLTLSTAASYPVRLELTQASDAGNSATAAHGLVALYLDKDADGIFNNDDVVVGYVNISGSGDFNTTYTAANLLSTGVTVTPASQTGSLIYTILDLDGNIIAKTAITLN